MSRSLAAALAGALALAAACAPGAGDDDPLAALDDSATCAEAQEAALEWARGRPIPTEPGGPPPAGETGRWCGPDEGGPEMIAAIDRLGLTASEPCRSAVAAGLLSGLGDDAAGGRAWLLGAAACSDLADLTVALMAWYGPLSAPAEGLARGAAS